MQTGDLRSAAGLLASFDAQQTIDKICTHAGGVNIPWKLASSLEDARSQTSDTHPFACQHMPGLSHNPAEQSKESSVALQGSSRDEYFAVQKYSTYQT